MQLVNGNKLNAMNMAISKILNRTYIVEEGYSNHWHYRKWSDGTAECWCRNAFSGVSSAGTIGGFAYNYITTVPNFPFEFIEEPTVSTGQFGWGSGYSFFSVYSVSKTKVGRIYVFTTNVGNLDGYYALHVIGKWK